MYYINQDLLELKAGVIYHQVNCFGIAGAGLAQSIRDKYPKWFDKYSAICKDYSRSRDKLLGLMFVFKIDENLKIASLFGQYYIGRNEKHTNYDALEKALALSRNYFNVFDIGKYDMYFPNQMGCGLAGGDWTIVERLIEINFPSAYICTK